MLLMYYQMAQKVVQHANGSCHMYTGYHQHGYGMIRKTINGKSYKIYVHQLAKLHQLNLISVPAGLVTSHLCHNKSCVNPNHINFETQGINNNRNMCRNEGICFQHHDEIGNLLPNCIFF